MAYKISCSRSEPRLIKVLLLVESDLADEILGFSPSLHLPELPATLPNLRSVPLETKMIDENDHNQLANLNHSKRWLLLAQRNRKHEH